MDLATCKLNIFGGATDSEYHTATLGHKTDAYIVYRVLSYLRSIFD